MPRLKSTIKKSSAVIALMDTTRFQDKAATVFAHLYATSMKITFQDAVYASLASTSSTISVPSAQQDRPTTFTNVFAGPNVAPIRCTTLTVASVIAPRATTSCREHALSVSLDRLTMIILKPAASFHARESMNTTVTLLNSVSARPSTSALEECAPTALLDTTMMPTPTHAGVSLDSRSPMASAIPSVPQIRPTSTENVSATMEPLSSRASASLPTSALSTAT